MISNIGFDKKVVSLENLLKYDLMNLAFYDDLLTDDCYYSSLGLMYIWSFNIDSLSMAVGEVKSLVFDGLIPSDLTPSPSAGDHFSMNVTSTDGSYVYSFLTDNEINVGYVGNNGNLGLYGKFALGGSGIHKQIKVIVKRIA